MQRKMRRSKPFSRLCHPSKGWVWGGFRVGWFGGRVRLGSGFFGWVSDSCKLGLTVLFISSCPLPFERVYALGLVFNQGSGPRFGALKSGFGACSNGCGSKIGTQNGTQVNGTKD